MTMRHALSQLVSQQILIRERGRGTFVSEPKIEQTLTQLTGFSLDMQSRGMRPAALLLKVAVEASSPAQAQALRVEAGTALIRLERLRLADGEPLAVECAFLPYSAFTRSWGPISLVRCTTC